MNATASKEDAILSELRTIRRNQDAQSQAIARLGLQFDFLISETRGLADRTRSLERWKAQTEQTLLEIRAERFVVETRHPLPDFDADDSPSGLHKLVPRAQFDQWRKASDLAKDGKSFRKLTAVGWRAATFVSCAFALVMACLFVAALVDAARRHPSLVQPEKP